MASPEKTTFARRRLSEVIPEENKDVERFPKRHSVALNHAKSTLVRRHSDIAFTEIQTVKTIVEAKKSKLFRQYSLINVPKILSERPNNKKELPQVDTADDLKLPRIPSAIPEPEEIKQSIQRRHSEALETEFRNVGYRPKYCWCLRCQLMYSMFKDGDDRLKMWGNYPCHRR